MPKPSSLAPFGKAGPGWRGLAPRLLAVVALLAGVAVALGFMADRQLAAEHDRLLLIEQRGSRLYAVGRATSNLLAFARAVEFLPIELPPEPRQRWEESAAEELGTLERRLQSFANLLITPANQADIVTVQSLLALYKPRYAEVLTQSRAGQLDAAGATATAAAPLVQQMRQKLRGVEDRISAAMETQKTESIQATSDARLWLTLVIAGGILVSVGLALFIVLRGVTGPLRRLSATAGAMAAGRIDEPSPELGRRDEVGAIARGLEALRGAALQARSLEAAAVVQREAAAAEQRQGRLALAGRVEAQLGAVVETLSGSARTLEANIGTLAGTAADTTQRAASVADAAGQATDNVQTVAAAADELAASVGEITRQVAQASGVARQAVQEAGAADATVASLNEAANRIGDVVRLIGNIAAQTNLLALNATIEAARAGEAGKGFAVVASEVKALAGQTAKATEEIGAQIGAIQSATEQAVQSIRGIAGVVGQVDQIAAAIAAAVEEQGAATQEIARNVAEAARGTEAVSGNITHVSSGMDATTAALQVMRETTGQVTQQGHALRGELRELLQGLRAA